jgi:hypothetical protein
MIFHMQIDLENEPLDSLALGRMLMELAAEVTLWPERGEFILLDQQGLATGVASFIRAGEGSCNNSAGKERRSR